MSTQPDREELTALATSLPLVELTHEDPILSELESSAVMHDLTAAGSTLPDRLHRVRALVVSEVIGTLHDVNNGEYYVLTERELTGAVARAVRRGATQAVVDLGAATQEVGTFYEKLGLVPEPETSPEDTPEL